jgi:hypothetical protein
MTTSHIRHEVQTEVAGEQTINCPFTTSRKILAYFYRTAALFILCPRIFPYVGLCTFVAVIARIYRYVLILNFQVVFFLLADAYVIIESGPLRLFTF